MFTDADEKRLRETARNLFAPLLADLSRASSEYLKEKLEKLREDLREAGRELDLRLAVREFKKLERELAGAGYHDRAALLREFREGLERDLERLLERKLEREAPFSPDRAYFARRRERERGR